MFELNGDITLDKWYKCSIISVFTHYVTYQMFFYRTICRWTSMFYGDHDDKPNIGSQESLDTHLHIHDTVRLTLYHYFYLNYLHNTEQQ